MSNVIVFDTETTGMGKEDRVIQLAFSYSENGGEPMFFQTLCNTPPPIKPEAMATHHITPDMIKDKPTLMETEEYKFFEECTRDNHYLVAHNIKFDIDMITKEHQLNGDYRKIDTLKVMRKILPNVRYHTLQYLRYYLGLYKSEQEYCQNHGLEPISAHDALGDVIVLQMLLDKLLNSPKRKYTLEELHQITIEKATDAKLRFGKYKGSTVSEIVKSDRSYLDWVVNSMDRLDPETKEIIEYQLSK